MSRLAQAVANTLGIAAKGAAKMQVRGMKKAKGGHAGPCCGKALCRNLAVNERKIKDWCPSILAIPAF
jgi:hypothetical protein